MTETAPDSMTLFRLSLDWDSQKLSYNMLLTRALRIVYALESWHKQSKWRIRPPTNISQRFYVDSIWTASSKGQNLGNHYLYKSLQESIEQGLLPEIPPHLQLYKQSYRVLCTINRESWTLKKIEAGTFL